MITIKMKNGKWRITILEETFEFESLQSMEFSLSNLLKIKNDYGRIKNKGEWYE